MHRSTRSSPIRFDEGLSTAWKSSAVASFDVVHVAGALELATVAAALAKKVDAVIAIGAVIEGETDHYMHVASETAAGLTRVALDTGIPIANAVLTVRNVEHARERSLPGPSNKGYEAADAAVLAANALRQI